MKNLILSLVSFITLNVFAQIEPKREEDYISKNRIQISAGYGFDEYGAFSAVYPLPGTTANHSANNKYNEGNATSFYIETGYRFPICPCKNDLVTYFTPGISYTYSYFDKLNYEDLENSTSVEQVNCSVLTFSLNISFPTLFKLKPERWDSYTGIHLNNIFYNFNYIDNPTRISERHFTVGLPIGFRYFIIKDFVGAHLEIGMGMPAESKIGLTVRL